MTTLKTKYGSVNVEFVHPEVLHVTTTHPLEYWKKLFHVDSHFDIKDGRVKSRKSSYFDKTFGIYRYDGLGEITVHQSKIISDEIVRVIDKYITTKDARIERKVFRLKEMRSKLARLNKKHEALLSDLERLEIEIGQRADFIKELEYDVARNN